MWLRLGLLKGYGYGSHYRDFLEIHIFILLELWKGVATLRGMIMFTVRATIRIAVTIRIVVALAVALRFAAASSATSS